MVRSEVNIVNLDGKDEQQIEEGLSNALSNGWKIVQFMNIGTGANIKFVVCLTRVIAE